jgi:hypothetical protein
MRDEHNYNMFNYRRDCCIWNKQTSFKECYWKKSSIYGVLSIADPVVVWGTWAYGQY